MKFIYIGRNTRLNTIIVLVALIVLWALYYVAKSPEKVGIYGSIATFVLSGFTLIVLFMTWDVYKELLKVSKQTLSFTRTQTSFNLYFDNYKLFDELSKRNTSIVLINEIADELTPFFKNMTFVTIHIDYINILKNFPKVGSHYEQDIHYDLVFKRFNAKIQSFIDIVFNEIVRLKTDNNLTTDNKITLIDLYRNFVLSDYISLCKDLIQNKEWFDSNVLPPAEISNLLKCNTKERIVFDTDRFLKLYYEIY
jgi:hypothetical protein